MTNTQTNPNAPDSISTPKRASPFKFRRIIFPLTFFFAVVFALLLSFLQQYKFPTGTLVLQKSDENISNIKNIHLQINMKKIPTLLFKPQWKNEGVGAKVIRVVGNQYLRRLDPFLMLDYFHVKLPAGFPDHPHRGFETVTYMINGEFVHQDFKGHKGIIGPGDIQWMTAGKGIVHSQMPTSYDVTSIGFQLWLNLKADNKMIQPRYQQLKASQIPVVKKEDKTVKVIAGEWEGVKGPIKVETPAYYFDVHFNQKAQFDLQIPQIWNSIIFVYEGQLLYSDQSNVHRVQKDHCARLSNGISLQRFKGQNAKFILIAGQPINEPVQQYGPFVMSSKQQLNQAMSDYQQAKNGFGGAHQWESEIKNLAHKKH